MNGLLAWGGAFLGTILFVLILNFAVDLIWAKPKAPELAAAPAAAPAAPAPAPVAVSPPPAAEPAPAPAPASAPAPVAPTPAPAVAEADPGQKVFALCKACHSLEAGKNLVGPSLAGIVGRARGSIAGFKYSDAMASSHAPWSEALLDKYLTDPKAMVPGTKMSFKGLASPADRAAVIAYLKAGGK
jgi:cytochrome c2